MFSGDDADARSRKEILEFLELDSIEETELTEDVRIILVSADFSSELATGRVCQVVEKCERVIIQPVIAI